MLSLSHFLFSFLVLWPCSGLDTIYIPLGMDANQRYIAPVDVSSNPTPQSFRFALSTSTGYTVVAGAACNACGDSNSYNLSESASAQSLPSAQDVQLFNGSASGPMVKELCSLREANGSSWVYPNQSMIVANQSSSVFDHKVSGIIGLGTNANEGSFSDTIFSGIMQRNPSETNITFGLALNPPYQDSTDGGMMHLGAADAASFQEPIVWVNASASVSQNNVSSDWTVPLSGWSFASGGNSISNTNGSSQAILDPYYSNIYLPQEEAQLIYASIPGASSQSSSTFSEVWTVPCSTKMNFSVTFQSQTFTMDQSTLLIQDNGTCTGVIEGWSTSNITEYLLGASFISAVYIIFNVQKPGGPPSSVGVAVRAVEHKAETGLIVGATLGSIAAAIAILVVAFLLYRSRRRRNPSQPERPSGFSQLFSLPRKARTPSSVQPFYGVPSGISDKSPTGVRFAEEMPSMPHTPASPHSAITVAFERNSNNLLRNSYFDPETLRSRSSHGDIRQAGPPSPHSQQDFSLAPFHRQQNTVTTIPEVPPLAPQNGKLSRPSTATSAGPLPRSGPSSPISSGGATLGTDPIIDMIYGAPDPSLSGSATVIENPPAYSRSRPVKI